MKRKILIFLTTLCMITVLIPANIITVSAYSGTKYGDYLYYRVSNKNVTITDCISSATEVEIPATINGYDVTSIGNEAFSYCTSLKSITIPNSVTSIGDKAFNFCSELKNIVLPDNVTLIGEYAFSSCQKLTNINIPNNVTLITKGMFTNCRNLYSIKIPNSVTFISSNAFYLVEMTGETEKFSLWLRCSLSRNDKLNMEIFTYFCKKRVKTEKPKNLVGFPDGVQRVRRQGEVHPF